MRLDAAPTYAFRARAAPGAPQAIGGVAPADPEDPAATTAAPVTPPPSLDGKGTLINTYA